MAGPADVSTDAVAAAIQARVREDVRRSLLRHGAAPAIASPEIYAELDALLRRAIDRSRPPALLLPELLGDPGLWAIDPAIDIRSHRGGAGRIIVFVKRRLIMPLVRFLFDYARENFERQQQLNLILFACVQELAIENAALRVDRRGGSTDAAVPRDGG